WPVGRCTPGLRARNCTWRESARARPKLARDESESTRRRVPAFAAAGTPAARCRRASSRSIHRRNRPCCGAVWQSRRAARADPFQGDPTLSEIIVVTSGKGGVGKTTTSASIACGLARRGKRVAVIDFDIGLRNLDLIMGCERRVVYDFVNVIQGECTLKQALIKDKRIESLYVLAASQTRDKDALSSEGVRKVLDELTADG